MRSGWRRSITVCALVLALACSDRPLATPEPVDESPHSAYLGRYRLRQDLVLVVRERDGLLTVLPSLWNRVVILEPVAGDRFRSVLDPETEVSFHRDTEGVVTELEVSGSRGFTGRASRLSPAERLPVEALLDGEPEAALRLLDETKEESPDRAVGLAIRLLANFPSRSDTAARFLGGLAERFPTSAKVQEARGMAWVSAGDREQALAAFRRTIELDKENSWARSGLRHLDPDRVLPEGEGWRTPFELADLFRAPTAEEIGQVRRRWRDRELSPQQVRLVERSTLQTDQGDFRQLLVSHLVHGELHHAAVLVPADATPGCCPVILDVRGISWDYRSRRVTPGLMTLLVLREEASRFVLAIPGLRGEKLELDGEAYLSEGDRTDGWDGAADDTIALLSVVLEIVPEADPERACAFGLSRGASVALLAASRDPRLDCVAAWAGPSDWFGMMGTGGWTLEEQVSDALHDQWRPGEGSGSAAQFVEWHLRGPIERGRPSLAEVRLRVTASSPLYFVDTLPPTDLHYGVEDGGVPVVNGFALRDRLSELGRSAPDYQVTFHEGAGHAMPFPWAFDQSREFLLRHLVETPVE